MKAAEKVFAPDYQRDRRGWIEFPTNDDKLRSELFPPEAMLHPAKANLFLIEALIEFTSQPGQVVMDIMGGSGSILIAVRLSRRVVAIDLNPVFAGCMRQTLTNWERPSDGMVLEGNCLDFLPISCHSIIFSPPYSSALKGTGGIVRREQRLQASLDAYQTRVEQHPANFANLPAFIYNQKMEEVYKLCAESLHPGGFLSVIIKDHIEGGVRIDLGYRVVQAGIKVGLELYQWHRWQPHGNIFHHIHKAAGRQVVEDEHILIFRKPGGKEYIHLQ